MAKAQEASESRFNGAVVWRCIKDLQTTGKGLQQVQVPAIVDENGNLCESMEEQSQRWQRHFTSVLNVCSSFDQNAINQIAQRPVADDVAEPPSEIEVGKAISHLSNGKAAGASGILPELVKCGGAQLKIRLADMFATVWREKRVPQEWVDATLIPIPKKGDLAKRDNWRGIALLDVGKVLARVIQTRLQEVASGFLPESQCGFRRGHSCSDMIFSVRQLLEKSIEHHVKGLFVFIDLKKAYDSVPRDCLWQVLLRAGIPENLVSNNFLSFVLSILACLL